MEWLQEITFEQWMYVVVKVTSIIGLLYAACSSMFISDAKILEKSYNALPEMKVYGLNRDNIILNVPADIIHENLKENTSLFLGFIVSTIGFVLEIVIETQELEGKRLLIIAIPIAIVCYFLLIVLAKTIAKIRWLIIAVKIEKNKFVPKGYKVLETDNQDTKEGYISTGLRTRECSWERMVVNGKVQDKN